MKKFIFLVLLLGGALVYISGIVAFYWETMEWRGLIHFSALTDKQVFLDQEMGETSLSISFQDENPWAFPLMEPKAGYYDENKKSWILYEIEQQKEKDAQDGLIFLGLSQDLSPIQWRGELYADGNVYFLLSDLRTQASWVLSLGEKSIDGTYQLIAYHLTDKNLEEKPILELWDYKQQTPIFLNKGETFVGPLKAKLLDSQGQLFELQEGVGQEQGEIVWTFLEHLKSEQAILLEKKEPLIGQKVTFRLNQQSL